MVNHEDFPIIARYRYNAMSVKLLWKPSQLSIKDMCKLQEQGVTSMDKIVT